MVTIGQNEVCYVGLTRQRMLLEFHWDLLFLSVYDIRRTYSITMTPQIILSVILLV